MSNNKCRNCGKSFAYIGHPPTRIHIFTQIEKTWYGDDNFEELIAERCNHDFYLCSECADRIIDLINKEYDNNEQTNVLPDGI